MACKVKKGGMGKFKKFLAGKKSNKKAQGRMA